MENYGDTYGAILFESENFKSITGHKYQQGRDVCLAINGDAAAHDAKMFAISYRPSSEELVAHVLTSGGSTMHEGPFRFDYAIICC